MKAKGLSQSGDRLLRPRLKRRPDIEFPAGTTWLAMAFVVLALVFGGGGSAAPVSELAVELIAAAIAAIWLWITSGKGAGSLDRRTCLLATTIVAVPLVQLVPLPPSLWTSLPGRQAEHDVLALAGATQAWMPWSVAPTRTLASLLSAGPPVLAMLLVASLPASGRQWVLLALAATVVLSLLLGALQLAAGETGAWRPYGLDNLGFLNGFQANRNGQADIVLIGFVAGSVSLRWLTEGRALHSRHALFGVWAFVLVLACFLTGSRAGIALIAVALPGALFIHGRGLGNRRQFFLGFGGLVFAGGLGLLLAQGSAVYQRVIARFSLGPDFRGELWEDTRFALAQYWPVGSGMGTFRPVFIAAERLEVVDPTMPVRAHNDYLELGLEAGLLGYLALALVAVCLARMAWTSWRERPQADRSPIAFAITALTIIALHSVLDYPLRSLAISCLAGVAAGLLSRIPQDRPGRGAPGQRIGHPGREFASQ